MQVIKKEKQMKEVDVTIESYTLCDKCDEKINTNGYDSFECKLIHKTGTSCMQYGSGETQEIELCQKCAIDLINFLRGLGYRVNDSNWDW